MFWQIKVTYLFKKYHESHPMTTNESGENANRIFIFTFSVAKVTLLIRIWILGGIILINFWEIRTFSKIQVTNKDQKIGIGPYKDLLKIKDPCWHSVLILWSLRHLLGDCFQVQN